EFGCNGSRSERPGLPNQKAGCLEATVHDENTAHRGKIDIERWLTTTIEKYEFQFKPFSAEVRDNETVVAVQVSGTFPGSPITLDYQFTIAHEKIASLIIDS